MSIRLRTIGIFALVIALITLIGFLTLRQSERASAPEHVPSLTEEQKTEAERLLRTRINSLSPHPAVLGGRFEVRDIGWTMRGTATVRYDDGESMLTGEATVLVESGGRLRIGEFEVGE